METGWEGGRMLMVGEGGGEAEMGYHPDVGGGLRMGLRRGISCFVGATPWPAFHRAAGMLGRVLPDCVPRKKVKLECA
ncbi:hypothetical protein E2C01_093723 [Portunus trituberculatus]|uniref:Uncharacterized protein n=1 Tax=Portunus trituberculatus TaxID=210409 RepID=A0A5B7JUY6_PORTR|nr:hypothetical protein [Portunus trituberculatus]